MNDKIAIFVGGNTTELVKLGIHDDFMHGECEIYMSDTEEIANFLKKNHSIINTLRIKCSSTSELIDMETLMDFFKNDTSIRSLELSNCYIQGCETIADMLATNKTLYRLYIRDNNLRSEGINSIFRSLESNTGLERLSIRGNKISPDNVTTIAKTLKINDSLDSLWLSDCDINCGSLVPIMEALKENKKLNSLYYYGNSIDLKDALAVADCLKLNKTLEFVILAHDDKEFCNEVMSVLLTFVKDDNNFILDNGTLVKLFPGDYRLKKKSLEGNLKKTPLENILEAYVFFYCFHEGLPDGNINIFDKEGCIKRIEEMIGEDEEEDADFTLEDVGLDDPNFTKFKFRSDDNLRTVVIEKIRIPLEKRKKDFVAVRGGVCVQF